MTSCGDAPAGGALPLPPPPASVGDADDELARTSFVHAAAADADTLYGLECDAHAYDPGCVGFPADEAATLDKIRYRIAHAGAYFMVARSRGVVVGFINGTRFRGARLTHDSMDEHCAHGESLGIHSVVVARHLQRRGLAVWMLREYLREVAAEQRAGPLAAAPVQRVALICKHGLIGLYAKGGFTLLGPSSVVHGRDPWYEMQAELSDGRSVPLWCVDAFADGPFTGNQAGVVLLPPSCMRAAPVDLDDMPTEWMQAVAAEMNVAETAFVARRPDGAFNLRWFTPTVEVALCGHATLGAAHALTEAGIVPPRQAEIAFFTRSGWLTCRRGGGGGDGDIVMDFPADPVAPLGEGEGDVVRAAVAAGLGLDVGALASVGRGRFDVLVEVSREDFGLMDPDAARLRCVDARGVIVTARATAPADGADIISRFFAPRVGVDEDPVTGSAHCTLASYWHAKLGCGGAIRALQASRRGGRLSVELRGERVLLTGRGVTTMRATLTPTAARALLEY